MGTLLLKHLLYQPLTTATGTNHKNAVEPVGDIQGHSTESGRGSKDTQIPTALYQFTVLYLAFHKVL